MIDVFCVLRMYIQDFCHYDCLVDAAGIVCGAGSMQQSSVSPSVCPIDRQQQQWPAGLLLSPRGQEILIDSCGRHAAGAALSSKCGQRYVDSRRSKLNTDLFVIT